MQTPSAGDATSTIDAWIARATKGGTFADVGGLWGTANEKVSIAARAGAASCTMIDITPIGAELWTAFRQRCTDLGVREYRCRQADINDAALLEEGAYDVVHCGGVLYHCPDPLHTLHNLARVCRGTLVLGTAVLPHEVTTSAGDLRLPRGSALFVPAVPEQEKQVVQEYFAEVGAVEIGGITSSSEWDLADYSPWWWLFTVEYVSAHLRVCGFRVLETVSHWQGRFQYFLAERTELARQ